MTMYDISVIVNCHREGRQLLPTLRSVELAIAMAQRDQITVEWLIIADSPDESTLSFLRTHLPAQARIVLPNVRDLSMARNNGVNAAQGKYVAFMDGDDLWSPNWLAAAYRLADATPGYAIFHPASSIYFGERQFMMYHPEVSDSEAPIEPLLSVNYWTALSFAAADIYRNFNYKPHDQFEGFGFEDWHWNCTTLAAGIPHKTVPGTFHCIRLKHPNESMASTAIRQACVFHPTPLFGLGYQTRPSSNDTFPSQLGQKRPGIAHHS